VGAVVRAVPDDEPAFEEAARLLEPDLRLVKLNSDEHQEIATRLGIRGIPTLILFAHGYELARTAGAVTTQQIVDWVRSKLPPSAMSIRRSGH